MVHIKYVSRQALKTQLVRKMAPPLVSLISAEPELQWVALRNINLLLQVSLDYDHTMCPACEHSRLYLNTFTGPTGSPSKRDAGFFLQV